MFNEYQTSVKQNYNNCMENIGIRITEEMLEEIDNEAHNRGVSRSEYIRTILSNRRETNTIESEYEEKLNNHKERIEDLKNQLEDVKQKRDRLQRQLRETNKRIDDVDEVVSYVKEEKEINEIRREREKKLNEIKSAPIWKRAKWKILGIPNKIDDGSGENHSLI